MRSGRAIGIVLLLLAALFAPTMACAFPGVSMTPEEHSCCRQMKGDCASMQMPASHSCCHKGVQAGHVEAVQPVSAAFHPPVTFVVFHPAALSAGLAVVYESIDSPQPSPPTSPPGGISVLRI